MQIKPIKLDRDNISDLVSAEVRNMIVDGRLPAGERINELRLSELLGVSRTPLREALARLTHEGALRSVPRIGYFVLPLTLEEFEQIYPIRVLLDPEALRLAGLPSSDQLEHLREINDRIKKVRDSDSVIEIDDAWHLELINKCPNRVLIGLVKQFMHRTRRYEVALMRERQNVLVTVADHEAVMAALYGRDLEAACDALRANLRSGRMPIVRWLCERAEPSAAGKEIP